jgi:hypothetical protein
MRDGIKNSKKMYEKFKKLKDEYVRASAKRQAEIDVELNKMAEENPAEFASAYEKALKDTAERINQTVLRNQLKNVENAISLSFIARKYFGKSKEWLYQRLNGYIVNGKPARFTENELHTLNGALKEIGNQISSVQLNY